MENVEIAKILSKYGDLLEIQGEGLLRVLAYRRAARTIESLSQPVAHLLREGKDLSELPGIGKSMAEHVAEIVNTGTLKTLNKLRKKLPTAFDELLETRDWAPNGRNNSMTSSESARSNSLGKRLIPGR
jgi:DNA polymerase (family 10)